MTGRVEQSARWMYRGMWSILIQWFRVPDQPPTLPFKPGQPIQSFQPDDGFLRYLKFWFWIVLFIMDLAILAVWIVITAALWWVGLLLLPLALFIAIVPDIIAFVAIHLRYDTTWYVMTDRSLRIRRGIWSIHETTITFENVQNLKVHQGPVQRYFGISNLIVETAGGGSASGEGHSTTVSNCGVIEGVRNAESLRDQILTRLKSSRSAGLGDEDRDAGGSRWTSDHLAVLAEIRNEIRQLAAAG